MRIAKAFLFLVTAVAAVMLTAAEDYSFYFLSDTHLGEASSFDMSELNPFRTKKDIYRADTYSGTFDAMFRNMAERKGSEVKMILSGGDLIEGGSYDAATHGATLQRAIDRICGITGLPLMLTNGNHDDWGKGGPEAFMRVTKAHLAKQPIPVKMDPRPGLNYTFEMGGDLYIVCDYHTKDSPWIWYMLEELKKESAGKYRYVFLLTHPALVCGGPSTEMVVDAASRYKSIFLCGHSHRTMILKYQGQQGMVSELMVGSMVSGNNPYRDPVTGPGAFWKDFLKRNAHVKSPKAKENIAFIEREGEHRLRDYFEIFGNGYARVDVSDKGVTVSLQSAELSQEPIVRSLY